MKLQVLQNNFSEALNISSRIASNRAQLPVLANVLLTAKKNKLQVAATNLEISVSISLGAKIEKQGELTVPARVITDLVSNLSDGPLHLSSEKEQLEISAQNFSSKISGMNASDFPAVPHEVGKGVMKLPAKEFIEALSQVLFAASIDETRPVLTGVLFIFSGSKLSLIATDGFRLSEKTISTAASKRLKGSKIILPKSALSEMSRLINKDDNIGFSYKSSDNQAAFGIDSTVLASRIIEGEFPDFEKIIPKESKLNVKVDKEEFLRAVKLASVFARDAANVVKLEIGRDSIGVEAESSQSGSQKAKVDAKVEGSSGKELKIAFNFRFLEDFLNIAKGEDIQIELSSSNSPGVFTDPKDPDFLHLIMPVRTQD
ncbi:MAG: DNA polymerase III subunit beta [Patescibacteria group bacterium]